MKQLKMNEKAKKSANAWIAFCIITAVTLAIICFVASGFFFRTYGSFMDLSYIGTALIILGFLDIVLGILSAVGFYFGILGFAEIIATGADKTKLKLSTNKEKTNDAEKIYCANCHELIKETDSFCSHCGVNLLEEF